MRLTRTICLLLILLAGCAPAAPGPKPERTVPPEPTATSIAEPTEVLAKPTSAMPLPEGEAGQAVAAARAFLAAALSVDEKSINLISHQEVEWSDGCLGLAGKDEMCTQAIVPGYLILLESGGVEYELHTSRSGGAVRLKPFEQVRAPGRSARCAAGGEQNLYQGDGFCFAYPFDFFEAKDPPGMPPGQYLLGAVMYSNGFPFRSYIKLDIAASAAGDTVETISAAWSEGKTVLETTPVALDGLRTLLLDVQVEDSKSPGDAYWVLFAVQAGQRIILTFSPRLEEKPGSISDVSDLYSEVTYSWRFSGDPVPEEIACATEFSPQSIGEATSIDSAAVQSLLVRMGLEGACIPSGLGSVIDGSEDSILRLRFETPGVELLSASYEAGLPWATRADLEALQVGEFDDWIEVDGVKGFVRSLALPADGLEAVYTAYVFPFDDHYLAVTVYLGDINQDESTTWESRAYRFINSDYPAYRQPAIAFAETLALELGFSR